MLVGSTLGVCASFLRMVKDVFDIPYSLGGKVGHLVFFSLTVHAALFGIVVFYVGFAMYACMQRNKSSVPV